MERKIKQVALASYLSINTGIGGRLEVEFSRLNTTNISLVEQREQELQFLQKEHASAYKQVLQLSKEKANLIGHQNEKQKIRYVKQMQEENHNLKKVNSSLELHISCHRPTPNSPKNENNRANELRVWKKNLMLTER